MDRTRPDSKDIIPVFLAKAGALGERAARAMCPNGGTYPLASLQNCNVITLQNEMTGLQDEAPVSARQRDDRLGVSAHRPGDQEATCRGAGDER